MNYTGFNVTWNETLVGVTVEAPCTGPGLNGKQCMRNMFFVVVFAGNKPQFVLTFLLK